LSKGYASAPGKVILAGEHSVVYGYPAIAVSIGLRCYVEITDIQEGIRIHAEDLEVSHHYLMQDLLDITQGKVINPKLDNIALWIKQSLSESPNVSLKIRSEIPISAGLGSSAAVAVATVAAIADLHDQQLSSDEISRLAFEAEKINHGTPSGIDNSIATYGGLLKFQGGKINRKKIDNPIPLIIGNTQIPRDTKHLVSKVASLKDYNPPIMDGILQAIGKLTEDVENCMKSNDLNMLGSLFNMNQGLLDAIGVGHPSISEVIWKMREHGALGAKLTGAGGGGCVIALAKDFNSRGDIVDKLKGSNIAIIPTEISPNGVLIGSSVNKFPQ
jgi:mevalonate kinase